MRIDILTLFPEMFEPIYASIIGRAVKNDILNINTINIRDYSDDKHKKTDDYPYGGGSGMLMTSQPVFDAYESIEKGIDYKPKVIFLTPKGKTLTQEKIIELGNEKHLVLLCGHYEGIDQRVIDLIVDEEISIGDYVLTGGEIPAMVLIDSVARVIPGVLKSCESYINESHFNRILEYSQYTRPPEFKGLKVPEILLSGNHAEIKKWRNNQALLNTKIKRPDLLQK